MKDYGLKAAERWALGYPSRPEFWDLMGHDVTVTTERSRKERGCICGTKPCRAKSTSDWLDDLGVWRPHLREERVVMTPVSRVERQYYSVTDFVPGAVMDPLIWKPTKTRPVPPEWWKGKPLDRLAAFWEYSKADAVRGMELVDWMRRRKSVKLEYQWENRLS